LEFREERHGVRGLSSGLGRDAAEIEGNRVISVGRVDRPETPGETAPRASALPAPPSRVRCMKVLFICKSNAARSQMAEAFFEHYSRKHSGMSAGLRTAHRGKEGHRIPRQVAEKMERLGIPMHRYRRKQLRRSMVQAADRVIVVMTPGQIRALLPKYVARSEKVTYWTEIKDPQNDRERIVARDQLRRRVRALVRQLG
jgi:protein-tyrosine-phosphatase